MYPFVCLVYPCKTATVVYSKALDNSPPKVSSDIFHQMYSKDTLQTHYQNKKPKCMSTFGEKKKEKGRVKITGHTAAEMSGFERHEKGSDTEEEVEALLQYSHLDFPATVRRMSPFGSDKSLNGEEGKQYPAPLASHQDAVRDPIVFWDTLRRFHFMMNTKFMIPVIGGKELDLHVLYLEVTKRGGYEKVVAEKKWREVGNIFRFSPTTTSASFVLRKHYFSLLYHYEQVYFFKLQGPVFTPTVSFPASNPSWRPELAIVEYSPKTTTDYPEPLAEGPSCISAIGTIEGKFDCGYLVSVKLGSEVLRGVLYHPEQPDSSTSVPESNSAIIPYTHKPPHHSGRRRRRRKSKRRGDPNYPKPNRSGYNFFFAEKHYKLKSLYPNREREFTKMIGESWTNLSPEERMVYQNIGLKDKERYKRELKEYKEKLKLSQAINY